MNSKDSQKGGEKDLQEQKSSHDGTNPESISSNNNKKQTKIMIESIEEKKKEEEDEIS